MSCHHFFSRIGLLIVLSACVQACDFPKSIVPMLADLGMPIPNPDPSPNPDMNPTGTPLTLTLNVTPIESARGQLRDEVDGTVCDTGCTRTLSGPRHVTLRAQAAPRSYFAGWSGACTGTQAVCELDVTKDTTVSATFRSQLCTADGWCWEYPRPQGNHIRGLYAASRSDVWATGEYRTLLHFNGTAWSNAGLPPWFSSHFGTAWGSSSTDIWISGGSSTLAHWDGGSWRLHTVPMASGFVGLCGTGKNDVWAVDVLGNAAHFDGASWAAMKTATTDYLTGCTAISAKDVWAVTNKGGAVHFDGTAWSAVATGFSGQLTSIWAASARDVWAVGYDASYSGAIIKTI